MVLLYEQRVRLSSGSQLGWARTFYLPVFKGREHGKTLFFQRKEAKELNNCTLFFSFNLTFCKGRGQYVSSSDPFVTLNESEGCTEHRLTRAVASMSLYFAAYRHSVATKDYHCEGGQI